MIWFTTMVPPLVNLPALSILHVLQSPFLGASLRIAASRHIASLSCRCFPPGKYLWTLPFSHAMFCRRYARTQTLNLTFNQPSSFVVLKHNCQSCDIPSKFLKLANTVVSKWLAELFNRCINEGVFPDSLKIAWINSITKIRKSSIPIRPQTHFCSPYIIQNVWKTYVSKSLFLFTTKQCNCQTALWFSH